MRVFVVGGSPAARQPSHLAPQAGDRVIAADGGALHARAWGWPIHSLVGDLDSLPAEAAADIQAADVPTLIASQEKDATDLELALRQALDRAPQELILCGALGGRTDHLLANVFLLARPDLAAADLILADGPETVRRLQSRDAPASLWLTGAPGDLVSLLPLGGDAQGIRTDGLYYPLRDETLYLGSPRGASNVMTQPRVHVSLRYGALLVIHVAVSVEPLV